MRKNFLLFTTLFFACAFHLCGKEKASICLNMIVKNESKVIRRSLDSVKRYIDYWVIVDTGSDDGTQDVIRDHLKDIPGELHERPWKNFGHNRMEALELAKGKADYCLFIDADDWLEFEEGFQFKSLEADMYEMWRGSKTFSYLVPQLIKTDLPWKWEGVVHNYLAYDGPYKKETLEGVRYVTGDNGARSKDPKKFLKNARVLEEALKEEPNNRRYVFYLGESYRDAGEKAKALQWYMKRSQMGGWDQEVFWSLLQMGHLQKDLGLPLDHVFNTYHQAFRQRPHRPEAIYYLAKIYHEQKKFPLSYALLKSRQFIPKPEEKDILFNLDWIEDYGLDFLLSIAAYWVGEYQESYDLCAKLLQEDALPESWKEQAIANQGFAKEKLTPKKPVETK